MTIFDNQFEEAQLLALIEAELDPGAAEQLRRRLGAHSGAVECIERLQADREILRSEPVPSLDVDLVAELEPLMVRPILMGPPGEFRRRRAHRRRWALPVAAGLGVALVGGLWAVLSWAPGQAGGVDERELARSPEGRQRDAETASGDRWAGGGGPPSGSQSLVAGEGSQRLGPGPGGVIHHHAPLEVAVAGGDRSADTLRPPEDPDARPRLMALTFALELEVAEPRRAEQILRSSLRDLGLRTALTRNLDWEEVQLLTEKWQRERFAPGQPPAEVRAGDVAAAAPPEPGLRTLREISQRLRRLAEDSHGQRQEKQILLSKQLLGTPELAPSFQQQLAFSEYGAGYTISIPLGELRALLGRLGVTQGHATRLRMLSPATDARPSGSAQEDDQARGWVAQWRQVQAAVAALRAEGDDTIVLLPVAIAKD